MSAYAHAAELEPDGTRIRVALAEDHALMRRSLRLLLDGEGDIEVVAEATTFAEVLPRLRAGEARVLVLDVGILGQSPLAAMAQLLLEAPEVRIVVLSMERGAAFAETALATGARGFVLKELADAQLPGAIRVAAADAGDQLR